MRKKPIFSFNLRDGCVYLGKGKSDFLFVGEVGPTARRGVNPPTNRSVRSLRSLARRHVAVYAVPVMTGRRPHGSRLTGWSLS